MKKYPTIEIFPVEATNILLDQKRSKREEYFVTLFDYCNLDCVFCWQDHDSKIGMDRVIPNAKALVQMIDRRQAKEFDCQIMGGELFCDDVSDEMFDQYLAFARIINDFAKPRGIDFTLTWVTNLIYSDNDRVIAFINELKEEMDVRLCTSYDPTGRFNTETLELFLKNLPVYGDMLQDISMVLTSPNIKILLRDEDKVFKKLYDDGYNISADYYLPCSTSVARRFSRRIDKVLSPDDTELLMIFYYLVDKYPNVAPVRDWIKNQTNELACRSSNVLFPDGSTGKCRKMVVEEARDDFTTKITEESMQDNSDIEHKFLAKNYCMTCEYFQRCGLGCYLQSDYTKQIELEDCVFKLTFDYITKGTKIEEISYN